MQWTDLAFVLKSLEKLFKNYDIIAVKIGIVPTLEYLKEIVLAIKKLSPKTKIVWDTVLKSTTEFDFLTLENRSDLIEILKKNRPDYTQFQRNAKTVSQLQLSPSLEKSWKYGFRFAERRP